MSRRKKLRKVTALKTTAQKLQKLGRMGDTELVHVNKYEEKVLERIRGGKLGVNPKTGLKEAGPLLDMATSALTSSSGVGAAFKIGQAVVSGYQAKKNIKSQHDIGQKEIDAKRKKLEGLKQIQPEHAQQLANLRKGAEEGMIDTQAAPSQAAQPVYQQGQSQQAQAMGQITRQGLEGSVIAQETSRKIGGDVRADIAEQSRQIAFKNEQTKAQAEQKLHEAMLKRGELLREIAGKQTDLSTESHLLGLKKDQALKSATMDSWKRAFGIAGGIATSEDFFPEDEEVT